MKKFNTYPRLFDLLEEDTGNPPEEREYYFIQSIHEFRYPCKWEYKSSNKWVRLNQEKLPGYTWLTDKIREGKVRAPALHKDDLGYWGWEEIGGDRYRLPDTGWVLAFKSWDTPAMLWLTREGRKEITIDAIIVIRIRSEHDMWDIHERIIEETQIFKQLK